LLLSQPVTAGAAGPELSPASALAIRAREGDDRAFDQLMASTQDRIQALAWRLLGNPDDARDAAQETYLRVYRHLARYRPDHDFEAWLYRIAVNVCRDFRRRRGAGKLRSFDEERTAGRIGERRRLMLEALAALPPRQRAALVLHDLEGKTSQQVARILGSRPGTVRSQLAAARARLKRSFALLVRRRDGRIP
jgi:RNA polymerase sigma-70 factor (ECF subfamily)